MQREILFKAIALDSKKWIQGDLVHWINKIDCYIIPDIAFISREMGEDENDQPIISPDSLALGPFYRVIPETVCQFVKKYDKMCIFEGDILRSINHYEGKKPYYIYHIISWSEKHSCYLAKSKGNDSDEIGDGTVMLWVYFRNATKPKIIGNIHDHHTTSKQSI